MTSAYRALEVAESHEFALDERERNIANIERIKKGQERKSWKVFDEYSYDKMMWQLFKFNWTLDELNNLEKENVK